MEGKTVECDVLVVGAGPAGSAAARASALAGLKTVFIDKRAEVGYPVRCAEGMGNYLFPFMPFKIPRREIVWETDGIEFWAEDITIRRRGVLWAGYTVNRRLFDKWVAKQAVEAGARLMLDAELEGFEFKGKHTVEEAKIKTKEGEVTIKPKVVVGADGFESTTLKLLGEYHPKEGAVAEIYSYEMKDMRLASPKYEQVFVGDFSESGYAYVFPISKTRANVGVGCAYPTKPIEEYFNEFLQIPEMKHQVKEAVRVENKGGKVNALALSKRWAYGNVLLAGDSADQNFKPFVEGILPAIICGDIAGKTAAKHLQGVEGLDQYTHEVKRVLGPVLNQSDRVGDLIYELFSIKDPKRYLLLLNLLADLNSPDRIHEMKRMHYDRLKDETLLWQEHYKQIPTRIQEYLWYQYIKAEKQIHRLLP
ncbi:MAG: NAD(P)/FAD-dependent oxidoreductase [Candidatus Altiarchaeota archaeon]